MPERITEILNECYELALLQTSSNLSDNLKNKIDIIVERSENSKGVVAVLITLLVYKIYKPEQDIRYHQSQLQNGFSGRTIDTNYVTPWIRSKNFPSMSSSGWLTRSLEQASPYTLDYAGKIKPTFLKTAFLTVIDEVQNLNANSKDILIYILTELIKKRDLISIDLAKPHSLSISQIINLLHHHFSFRYTGTAGASRLPTLAIYAAYKCMIKEVARYNGKTLLEMASHTSADARSGRIGDIDIWDNDKAFEAVEIKHEIVITPELVKLSYEKFKVYPTDRYYLLTTANMNEADWLAIDKQIENIKNIHGCQVIVNGVYSTLKYYLRLVKNTADFIDYYVELMKSDETLKFVHKQTWNDLVSNSSHSTIIL